MAAEPGGGAGGYSSGPRAARRVPECARYANSHADSIGNSHATGHAAPALPNRDTDTSFDRNTHGDGHASPHPNRASDGYSYTDTDSTPYCNAAAPPPGHTSA